MMVANDADFMDSPLDAIAAELRHRGHDVRKDEHDSNMIVVHNDGFDYRLAIEGDSIYVDSLIFDTHVSLHDVDFIDKIMGFLETWSTHNDLR